MEYDEVIKGCIDNDRVSQKSLYKIFREQMYAICFRYCRNEYDAQEALQKGFIRIFQHIKDYRFDGSFEGWVRKIMIRSALNQIKSKRTISFDEVKETDGFIVEANENMTYESLLRLIDRLPEGYAMVFGMYVLDDLSHAEIARILGVTESTSRSQLTKAKKLLRIYFDKEINFHYE